VFFELCVAQEELHYNLKSGIVSINGSNHNEISNISTTASMEAVHKFSANDDELLLISLRGIGE
jgi:hypothetical protein